MKSELQKGSIKGRVFEKINSGSAQKRPRSYFIAHATLLVVGMVLLLLTLLYLTSFIFFVMRQTGVWFVPAFGAPGFRTLILASPWLLILVAVIFVVLLEYLVKKYSFAYRRPLLYSVIGILVFVLIGGFVVARSPLHHAIYRHVRENRLPIAGPLYKEFGMKRLHDVHPGKITALTDSGFTIETPGGEPLAVVVSAQTRFPFGSDLQVNDIVVVFGNRDNTTIQAFGVRRIDESIEPFQIHARPRGTEPPPFLFRPKS